MAPHSSTLAWKIPWMEEPGRLHSMGSRRVGHNPATSFHFLALEKEMATHSSVLAWRIPGTEEPGGLPSMGSHRVGHDWSDAAAAAAASACSLQQFRMLGMISAVFEFFSFEVFDWLQLSFSHWSSAVSGQTCQSSLFWGQICMLYISVIEDFSHSQYLMHVIVLVFSCVWFTCKVSCLEYKQQREPFSCVIVYLCFRNTLRCN